MMRKNIKDSFWGRWFRPRDVFIREQDKIAFCSLSAKRQWGIFLVFCIAAVWGGFTSFYFFRYNAVSAGKEAELNRIRADYANLQGEVLAFADHLNRVVSEIDDNQQAIQALQQEMAVPAEGGKVRKADSVPSAEKLTAGDKAGLLAEEAGRLKNETVLVRERLAGLMENGGGQALKDGVSFHQVLLQRDIAAAESRALQEKVRNLEKQISGMQETQILVFRKMASLAGGNIDMIEDDLAGIRQSLAGTGLGMESLLNRIRRNKENVGIGGPFIPAPMSKPQHHLNISLVSLNQRLDRWYDLTTLQDALPIGKPIERIRVTSPFGSRGDPFQGAPAHHEAVDLGGMIGEPIHTTAPGKVVRAGRWGWYGNMVEIDHGLGFRTRYAHMDKIFVTKGDTVHSGDRIGTVGNTGRSTGPHLHYEIRVRGHAVDPMKFIKAKKNVFKG
ncbi:MAG: peptidoglycan DD-metalloendopeptidase family protein [Alphaproteobacteria bacterium]